MRQEDNNLEQRYKEYDAFLKLYLEKLEKLGSSFDHKYLIISYNEDFINEIFLATIFDRIGKYIGYKYKFWLCNNSWFNQQKMKRKLKIPNSLLVKNTKKAMPGWAIITGSHLVNELLKDEKYEYLDVYYLMKEILEQYYGIKVKKEEKIKK